MQQANNILDQNIEHQTFNEAAQNTQLVILLKLCFLRFLFRFGARASLVDIWYYEDCPQSSVDPVEMKYS